MSLRLSETSCSSQEGSQLCVLSLSLSLSLSESCVVIDQTPAGVCSKLSKLLKLQDTDGRGRVGASVFKRSLARAGAPLSEKEFSTLASVIVEHGR